MSYEPLTETRLAEAAGLDLATLRHYLHLYGAHLAAEGSGRAKRWSPTCAEKLRLIQQLTAAGRTPLEIQRALEGKPLQRTPAPRAPEAGSVPRPPVVPATPARSAPSIQQEVTRLRERLQAEPVMEAQEPPAPPWWRRWWPW
jgi:DNA-binding transcriptional MerR regulator